MKLRLPASSLTEVLVALAIASIIFVIGTMVFLNLSGPSNASLKAERRWIARNLMNEAVATASLQDQTVEQAGARFLRTVKPVNAANGLYELRVLCIAPDETVVLDRVKLIHLERP